MKAIEKARKLRQAAFEMSESYEMRMYEENIVAKFQAMADEYEKEIKVLQNKIGSLES